MSLLGGKTKNLTDFQEVILSGLLTNLGGILLPEKIQVIKSGHHKRMPNAAFPNHAGEVLKVMTTHFQFLGLVQLEAGNLPGLQRQVKVAGIAEDGRVRPDAP
jgi:hypothetical protein